ELVIMGVKQLAPKVMAALSTFFKGAEKGGERVVGNVVRTEPKNLLEQMTMDAAKIYDGEDITSALLKTSGKSDFNNTKFSIIDGWRKYQFVGRSKYGENATIHYWYNINTGIKKGYKFK
ncbi:MAG TPA: hypothetical protein PLE30_10880, partial [Candidatus Kapabacteria bacterium]|nr:hypothetical protein [Candidatus Kapabacteria bacterium]